MSGWVTRDTSVHLPLQPIASQPALAAHLFQRAMADSPIPMTLVTVDGRFLSANAAFCDYLGYDEPTLVSLTWQDLTHSADLAMDLHHVHRVTRGEIDGYRMVKRYLRADGSVVVGELHVSDVRDDAGALQVLVAQIVDITQRQRDLEEREESEERYRLLAENTSDVVTLAAASGEILWASPSWATILQRDPESATGTTACIVHPDDDPTLRTRVRDAASCRLPRIRMRLRVTRADGSHIWMDSEINLVYHETGGLAYTRTSMRDVSEQVAAEQELAAGEERYRLLAEHSMDVILRVGAGRTIEWASPSTRTVMGLDPDDLMGRSTEDLVHPDDRERFRAAIKSWRTTGGAGRINVRFQMGDGGYRWFEEVSSPITRADGSSSGRAVRLRDIEAEVQAAQSLAASEEMFRRAMADSGAGMALIAPDGRYLEVNDALCKFLGYDRETLCTKTWQELSHPEDLGRQTQHALALRRGEIDSYRVVKRYLRPDGDAVVGDVTVSAIRDSEERFLRYVSQIVDVTEQQRVTSELAESEGHFRLLAEHTTDLVARARLDGVIEWVSQSVAQLGYTPQQIIGAQIDDLIHDAEVPSMRARKRVLLGGEPAQFETRFLDAENRYQWYSVTVSPILDDSGDAVGVVASARNIEAEVAARQLAQARAAEFRLLAETTSDLVIRTDGDGLIEWASPSAMTVLGYDAEDLVGMPPTEFIPPDEVPQFLESLAALRTGAPNRRTVRLQHADGTYSWFSALATNLDDKSGKRLRYAIGLRDVDAEVKALAALSASEERFRAAMASAPGGMAVVGLDRGLVAVNDALADLLGRTRQWLVRHTLDDIVHLDDLESVLGSRRRVGHGQVDRDGQECRLVRSDGTVVWVQHATALMRRSDGTSSAFISQFVDITAAVQARADLEFLARHDPLTRLANRRVLVDAMQRLLSQRPRGGRPGLLFVDLDGLKPVNDEYGHPTGDELIVETARRIQAAVRSEDLVARLGGDEFVVLLPAVHGVEDVVAVGDKIREAITAPVHIGDLTVHVTASAGATLAEPGEKPEAVLRRADTALYVAKESGRNRTVAG